MRVPRKAGVIDTLQRLSRPRVPIVATPLALDKAELEGWNALPFASGWEDYGSAFTVAKYRKNYDGLVQVRGLVKHEGSLTALTYSTIGTLPVGFRPGEGEIFDAGGSRSGSGDWTPMRVDVDSAGVIKLLPYVTGVVEYVTLGQISFYTD